MQVIPLAVYVNPDKPNMRKRQKMGFSSVATKKYTYLWLQPTNEPTAQGGTTLLSLLFTVLSLMVPSRGSKTPSLYTPPPS